MLRIYDCVVGQHDLRYVAAAALICMFACYTAIGLMVRARLSEGRAFHTWVAAASVVSGLGIWATHFVAMLAFQYAIPVAYDLELTVLSIVCAVGLNWCGYQIALSKDGNLYLGGAVVGLAVAGMHYIGTLAIRMPAEMGWDLWYVVLSVMIGISFCGVVLRLTAVPYLSSKRRVACSAMYLFGIVGLHFTAMTGLQIVPDPRIPVPSAVLDPELLSVAVISVSLVIIAIGFAGSVVDQQFSDRSAQEARRLRIYVTELENTRKQLEETTARLAHALEEAAAGSQAKSVFLATMSHEIRTPMNGILGMVNGLLDEEMAPGQLEKVRIIKDSGESLLDILNDILDLSKIEAGHVELERVDFDLTKLLNSVSTLWTSRTGPKNVEFSIENELDDHAVIRADSSRIRQVLYNLINNAVKFTDTGSIRVSVKQAPPENGRFRLRFEVRDTGIGLDEEAISKLFEPFSQADNSTTRKYGGTGLGLAICRNIVELHQGEIGVTSKPGEGSCFWFEIVVEEGSRDNLVELTSSEEGRDKEHRSCEDTIRILVAEDNAINQKVLDVMLSGVPEFRFEFVTNGQEALTRVTEEEFDIVLMDVQMPEMDGPTATGHIRALPNPQVANTPIIALTANAMKGDREHYMSCGMNDYVSKPIDRQALHDVIFRWTDSGEPGQRENALPELASVS